MSSKPTLRIRRAARSLVISGAGRILLFRFELADRPPFWVTPGGECDAHESFKEAARRELFEETGIVADPGEEVAQTTPQFVTVEGESVQADERYFLVRVEREGITTAHHTDLEKKVMTQHRWFAPEELDNWPEAIFPQTLRQLMETAWDR
ncbi:MAG: NUDIX domain-containing protein [Erythrobacter sp.]|uniref:NUDIX hydrolase n=1 Tax=Erythrobacter sp. TaxID=1042 RepID=UPI002631578C|nr:NUDIX domain-containing protein [Erythrobacter sp.]MDJ0977033.1 NUDIX domain-containing protein [Erythrobacter sp.]